MYDKSKKSFINDFLIAFTHGKRQVKNCPFCRQDDANMTLCYDKIRDFLNVYDEIFSYDRNKIPAYRYCGNFNKRKIVNLLEFYFVYFIVFQNCFKIFL